ncbi:MAG TPA: hypothetical protein VKB25_13815 [Conexibacter sp.]|nr:hypothetical protein [Conexibacter sp.]
MTADQRSDSRDGRRARCFMHVPKSAGSSVFEALTAAFPAGAIAPQRHDHVNLAPFRDFDALAPQLRAVIATNSEELLALAQFDIVCGHFVLPSLLRIARPEAIATIVREPRARLLSLYAYWAIEDFSAAAPYAAWQHASRPLCEFLSEVTIAPVIDNQLCRMLLHGDPRIPMTGFIARDASEALVEESLRRLETLGFVGIQELPDGLWDGLSTVFRVPLEPERANVTASLRGRPRCPPIATAIDEKTLTLLEHRTDVDGRIYRELVMRTRGASVDPDALATVSFLRQLVALGTVLSEDDAFSAATRDG